MKYLTLISILILMTFTVQAYAYSLEEIPLNEYLPQEFFRSDAETLFSLANNERIENGLSPYKWDEKLNEAAQLKADDMAKNNYLSHYSESYGTPFKMLKEQDIRFMLASENIGINTTITSAHSAFLDNAFNRFNILNKSYTKMGVGIANSQEYGKIVVEIFIRES